MWWRCASFVARELPLPQIGTNLNANHLQPVSFPDVSSPPFSQLTTAQIAYSFDTFSDDDSDGEHGIWGFFEWKRRYNNTYIPSPFAPSMPIPSIALLRKQLTLSPTSSHDTYLLSPLPPNRMLNSREGTVLASIFGMWWRPCQNSASASRSCRSS